MSRDGYGVLRCASPLPPAECRDTKNRATDLPRIARQFASIVEPRPALVPLTFDAEGWKSFAELAGVAIAVRVRCNVGAFDEDLLFTHRGLSGPAILQISSYWNPRDELQIDLLPARSEATLLADVLALKRGSRQTLSNALSALLPHRLAEQWVRLTGHATECRIAEVGDGDLRALASSLKQWRIVPTGTEGYRKVGDARYVAMTNCRSTFAARAPGPYFIGRPSTSPLAGGR
jgi:predicted flavoprotein YhiN